MHEYAGRLAVFALLISTLTSEHRWLHAQLQLELGISKACKRNLQSSCVNGRIPNTANTQAQSPREELKNAEMGGSYCRHLSHTVSARYSDQGGSPR